MNLNFILENYSVLKATFFLGMILLTLIGVAFILSPLQTLGMDLFDKKNISVNSLIVAVSSLIIFGSYQGVHFLKLKSDNLHQEITVNSDYNVMIVDNGLLSLRKKKIVDIPKLETTTVNGIQIEKNVMVQIEEYRSVLKVRCGSLSFDACFVKIKDSLGTITGGMNESGQKIVQF